MCQPVEKVRDVVCILWVWVCFRQQATVLTGLAWWWNVRQRAHDQQISKWCSAHWASETAASCPGCRLFATVCLSDKLMRLILLWHLYLYSSASFGTNGMNYRALCWQTSRKTCSLFVDVLNLMTPVPYVCEIYIWKQMRVKLICVWKTTSHCRGVFQKDRDLPMKRRASLGII